MIDYLGRRQGLSYEETANVIAAPFWSTIEGMPPEKGAKFTYLRNAFPSMRGPHYRAFFILLGFEGGMMALNDRLKLRSMVVADGREGRHGLCGKRRVRGPYGLPEAGQDMGAAGRRAGDCNA